MLFSDCSVPPKLNQMSAQGLNMGNFEACNQVITHPGNLACHYLMLPLLGGLVRFFAEGGEGLTRRHLAMLSRTRVREDLVI